jgi:predicted membrane protein
VPLLLLGIVQVTKLSGSIKKILYVVSGCLVQVAIFSMRWNVVIGGQLFSKSFLGYTTYKMSLITREGFPMAVFLALLPLGILWALVKVLPPWHDKETGAVPAGSTGVL